MCLRVASTNAPEGEDAGVVKGGKRQGEGGG